MRLSLSAQCASKMHLVVHSRGDALRCFKELLMLLLGIAKLVLIVLMNIKMLISLVITAQSCSSCIHIWRLLMVLMSLCMSTAILLLNIVHHAKLLVLVHTIIIFQIILVKALIIKHLLLLRLQKLHLLRN